MTNYTHPSILKFKQLVELKDYRLPTKKEYVRYVWKLAEHFDCDPASLSENQVRQYFLFLRQELHASASVMKGAKWALRCFYRESLKVTGWTVFEDLRVAEPKSLPTVLGRGGSATVAGQCARASFRNLLAADVLLRLAHQRSAPLGGAGHPGSGKAAAAAYPQRQGRQGSLCPVGRRDAGGTARLVANASQSQTHLPGPGECQARGGRAAPAEPDTGPDERRIGAGSLPVGPANQRRSSPRDPAYLAAKCQVPGNAERGQQIR